MLRHYKLKSDEHEHNHTDANNKNDHFLGIFLPLLLHSMIVFLIANSAVYMSIGDPRHLEGH